MARGEPPGRNALSWRASGCRGFALSSRRLEQIVGLPTTWPLSVPGTQRGLVSISPFFAPAIGDAVDHGKVRPRARFVIRFVRRAWRGRGGAVACAVIRRAGSGSRFVDGEAPRRYFCLSFTSLLVAARGLAGGLHLVRGLVQERIGSVADVSTRCS